MTGRFRNMTKSADEHGKTARCKRCGAKLPKYLANPTHLLDEPERNRCLKCGALLYHTGLEGTEPRRAKHGT